MIAVQYDADTDQIWITGEERSYPRRSLVACIAEDGRIGLRMKFSDPSDFKLMTDYANLMDGAGNGFASRDDAKSYLDFVIAQRRPVGETFGVPAVAGADLAQGHPVAVSRASGQLLPARADTYTLAFVAGVASADTAQGFANRPAHGAVTLPDWTALTGSPDLSVGQLYFVGPAGGLTTAPRLDTQCIARVGLATAPQTLVVEPSTPIIL